MSTPYPPKWDLDSVQQPLPIFRSTSRSSPHTIELLERRAEHMSLNSVSSCYSYDPYANLSSLQSQQYQQHENHPKAFQCLDFASTTITNGAEEHTGDSELAAQVYIRKANTEFNTHEYYQSMVNNEAQLAAPQSFPSVSRVPSIASGSTLRYAGSLFKDFDGAHYIAASSIAEEESCPEQDAYEEALRRIQAESATQTHGFDGMSGENDTSNLDPTDYSKYSEPTQIHILPSQQEKSRLVEPPPAKGMVYYPAPVPVSLNRPQRISKLPSSTPKIIHRSDIFLGRALKARTSTLGLPESDARSESNSQRAKSLSDGSSLRSGPNMKTLRKLPPQLRASVFFDQPSMPHQIRIKHGSAVETLECLLDAAAKAPSNATLDETMRNAMKEGSARERKVSKLSNSSDFSWRNRSSVSPVKKARSDKMHQLLQPDGQNNELEAVDDDELENERGEFMDSNIGNNELIPLADGTMSDGQHSDSDADDHLEDYEEISEGSQSEDEDDDAEETNVWTDDQHVEAPTTLLAELQLRKQELKSRTRAAPTAFQEGMHSTLLELEAVAQIEKKRRKTQRTALAWEDPEEIEASNNQALDEDVPLGVLFSGMNGSKNHAGVNEPYNASGLLQKRDLEENEPLSRRRNRLKGAKARSVSGKPPGSERSVAEDLESEHEDETLAQRTRRLKFAKALNGLSSEEAERSSKECLGGTTSQLGAADESYKASELVGTLREQDSDIEQEETLGQRRLRLLAEGRSRDVPSESNSELLVGRNLGNSEADKFECNTRHTSGDSSSSGLLEQSENIQKNRRELIAQRNQSASYNLSDSSLIDIFADTDSHRRTSPGLLGQSQQNLELRQQHLSHINGWSTSSGSSDSHTGSFALDRQYGAGLGDGRSDDDTRTRLRSSPQRSVSGFPHQQSQANALRQGFGNGGFGISPRHMSSSQLAAPLSYESIVGQRVQADHRFKAQENTARA